MRFEDNPMSIKYYVKKYLHKNAAFYKGKTVIDFPAGNGITSRILREIGANPIPMDLFPEYFKIEGIECSRANIRDGLPVENKTADALICQEGIEHFSDQFSALKEFNRVLKMNGVLLITTPNYSNLRSKLSYLLSESERFISTMPPNELDSIWVSKQEITDDIYFGHIFLIGVQKLRVLAKLSGFRIKKFHFTRVKTTSLLLFPLFYPFILLSNWITYKKSLRKNKEFDTATKKKVYGEIFRLSIDPKILIGGTLMVEFIKDQDYDQVSQQLRSRHQEFGIT
ncbi:class I SAM-dependent methyltransferase [Pontibacter diazotrophicus]|uniref:Class I SAM-dependent methyltransferase n=1 Tax=Pontibacter diazotrophicus TaxID=1400979 RepID=A0A3D8LCI8_9BACT|nr:class I SAM-dependent methyltransferase [Pontibacter diazotrophicus]RDV14994.1 class I SAM-dependent methyltransferase [Pontibacter diazotrophicus]